MAVIEDVLLEESIVLMCSLGPVYIGCFQSPCLNELTEVLTYFYHDYLGLFINISKSNIFKLQKVQNAAARLIVRGRKRSSMTEVLRQLHWLRVESRIMFKIILIVFKCIYGQCSSNLIELIKYKPHQCRPQDHLLLETRRVKTKYGRRTFSYVGPKLWNALPLQIRLEENMDSFKKQVKTLLFDGTEQLKKRAFPYD